MSLLAIHSQDVELRELYRGLLSSEARHFGVYWTLAEQRYPKNVIIDRLKQLSLEESLILSQLHSETRMHS